MKFGGDLLDQLVTVNTPFNPKQKGTKAYERFEKYDRDKPITVTEYLERGGTSEAIRYDLNWGYVTLTDPSRKPIELAREMTRSGLEDAEYVLIYRHPSTGTRVVTNVTPKMTK